MDSLQKAKDVLEANGYTFVAIKGECTYCSIDKGISPIMEKVVDDKEYFKGYSVADRVIGKSAALLLIRSHIACLHTKVLSEHAKTLLDQYQISYSYDTLVPYIINRTKDGMCPMEHSVLAIEDLEEGFMALQTTLKQLRQKKDN